MPIFGNEQLFIDLYLKASLNKIFYSPATSSYKGSACKLRNKLL